MELIIGQQPEVPYLPMAESQNRFNLVFLNFVRVFCRKGRSLVLFLDDLQWAGLASLNLIEQLITDKKRNHIFIIGAYRDSEVDVIHPLMVLLDKLEQEGVSINSIQLKPLNEEQVNQLISETLNCERKTSKALAGLCYEKTQGNPYFLSRFFNTLYEDGLINFAGNPGQWQWDVEEIRQKEMTENVVELMIDRLQKLPGKTQNILRIAACIGSQFDLITLSNVNEKTVKETADELWESLREGLIVPNDASYRFIGIKELELEILEQNSQFQTPMFRFHHDRIQQAAYATIPEERKREIHLKAGWLLLEHTGSKNMEDRIFDIVHHLNNGRALMKDSDDRIRLARLNLTAGIKAKKTAAYEPSRRFFEAGYSLLGENGWKENYKIMLNLTNEAAETAYLCSDFERFSGLRAEILKETKSLFDKIKIYELEMLVCYARNKPLEVIGKGLRLLSKLGFKLPGNPNILHIVWGLLRIKYYLRNKRIEDLRGIKEMTNPDILSVIRLYEHMGHSVYFSHPRLLVLIVFQYVILSVRYGITSSSSFGFAAYGMLLSSILGKIKDGSRFGQLALSLAESPGAKISKAKTIFVVNSFIYHRNNHLRETFESFLKAYRCGLEIGDIEYASLSAYALCINSYLCGDDLKEVVRNIVFYRSVIEQFKQKTVLNILNIHYQAILNLTKRTLDPCSLNGEAYREDEMTRVHEKTEDKTALFLLYFNKMQLNYWFGNYERAIEMGEIGETCLDGIIGAFQSILFYFFDSLSRLADFLSQSGKVRKKILRKVAANQKKMKKWADYAPMNHLHRWILVEAERARIAGDGNKAIKYYDRAISLAGTHNYLQDEAMANELAGRYWIENKKEDFAALYFKAAHYLYQLWGATRKARHLENSYPSIFQGDSSSSIKRNTGAERSQENLSLGLTASTGALDIETIMRASQTLSKGVQLEQLLENMVRLVMENTGATKGVLLTSDNENLQVQAKGKVSGDKIESMLAIPLSQYGGIPHSIVNYTARTQTAVVLNDATNDKTYTRDTYIQSRKPKSVLCMPIVHLGKLLGVLYLENNLISDAFTPDRLELLKILSSAGGYFHGKRQFL